MQIYTKYLRNKLQDFPRLQILIFLIFSKLIRFSWKKKTFVYPRGHLLFYSKLQILQLYPNGHSLCYSKIRNFTFPLKWEFVFIYSQMQNFETVPKRPVRFFTTKYRVLTVVPKWPFVFPTKKCEIYIFIINLVSFLKSEKFLKYDFEISCFVFLQ